MLIFNKHITASLLQIAVSFNIAYCLPFRHDCAPFHDYYLDPLQQNRFVGTNIKLESPLVVWFKVTSLVWTLGVDAVFLDRSQMPSVPIMNSLCASTHNINQTHQSNTDKCQLPQELFYNKSFVFDCQRQPVQLLGNVFFSFSFLCLLFYSFNFHSSVSSSCSEMFWFPWMKFKYITRHCWEAQLMMLCKLYFTLKFVNACNMQYLISG